MCQPIEQWFLAIEQRLAQMEMLLNAVMFQLDQPCRDDNTQEKHIPQKPVKKSPAVQKSPPTEKPPASLNAQELSKQASKAETEAPETIKKLLASGKRLTTSEIQNTTGLSKGRFIKARKLFHSRNQLDNGGDKVKLCDWKSWWT